MSKLRVVIATFLIVGFLVADQFTKLNSFLDVVTDAALAIFTLSLAAICVRSAWVRDFESHAHIAPEHALKLSVTRVYGSLMSVFCPRYGQCERCLVPWNLRRHHLTPIICRGFPNKVFAVCQHCYNETTPEARLKYYAQMWSDWVMQGMDPAESGWEFVKTAVMSEDSDA
jgi:hypothetical protein